MSHDQLCGLSQPCDDEVPEHGYCSRQHGQFCIHCLTWCICDRLKQAEERVIPEAVQRVEALAWQHQGLESTFPLRRVIEAIKAGARTEIKMGMNVYRELWESEPDSVVDGFKCSIMRQYPDAEITDISVAYQDPDWSHAPRKVGLIATVKIK